MMLPPRLQSQCATMHSDALRCLCCTKLSFSSHLLLMPWWFYCRTHTSSVIGCIKQSTQSIAYLRNRSNYKTFTTIWFPFPVSSKRVGWYGTLSVKGKETNHARPQCFCTARHPSYSSIRDYMSMNVEIACLVIALVICHLQHFKTFYLLGLFAYCFRHLQISLRSFYRCSFDPNNGGEMSQLEYVRFLKTDGSPTISKK